MSPLPDHLRVTFARRFQDSIASVNARTIPAVRRAFDDLDNYDEDQIDTLTKKTAPALRAAKVATVSAAVGFYSTIAGVRPPAIAAASVVVADGDAAIRDPFIAVWRAFKMGRPYEEAVAAGQSRLEAVVENFTNGAARQTGDLVVTTARVRTGGWERVTNSGACDWCELVSGQTYSSADAADFGHDRCGCTPLPLL